MEELIPYISLITAGDSPINVYCKWAIIAFIVLSIAFNVLVRVYPASAQWVWVQMCLALLSNVHDILTRILKKPEPPKPLPPPPSEEK